MRTFKFTILFICVFFTQQLRAQMFTAPYQAVNYQKVISNGLTLDGVDDYVQLPANVYFNGDFTFECWVELNAYTNWARIFDFGAGGGTSTNQFLFGFITNNTPSGWIHNSSFSFPSGIELGKWTHLALTQSGTTLTGYVNGVSVLTTTITAPANATRNSCFIGKSNYTGDANSNISLDEFRIWNYARTANQIQSTMNTELVGYESGLVVYYNFNIGISNAVNTGRTTVFNEALANTYNGTLYNSSLSGFTSNWTVGKVEPLVPSNNLRLYVDAGKPRSYPGSGSLMTDLSPSGNNMTLYNSPTYSSTNGGTLSFNGSNTYLVSNSSSPITGASPRTVCIWYNPTTITNASGSLFWTGLSGVSYTTYGIGFAGGKYQFWGNNSDVTDAALAPTANSWNFIAAAYGGGTSVYQYLNGVGNLKTISNTLNTASGGCFFSKDANGFNGRLGNIMVFDRMLSKQELDKLYNNMRLRVPDGSTAQNAAVSGLQLHIDYPSLASGWYWIKSPTMPNPLQMYVDKTEDGGGYDFYPITAGPSVNYVNVNNGGTALGLDIVYPRSKNHWKAMTNAVTSAISTSRAGGGTYNDFFKTTYGVYRVGTAGNGNGDYTSKTMRSAEYGGTTNVKDWRVKDGGIWWLRDGIYGEPNGDYTDYGFLGMGSFSNTYNLTNIEFNDGNCCTYSTGNFYLVSTNTKKGVVYDNNLLLYVDPSIAGSYSSGTTVSDLSANLNHGTLSNVSFVNTGTTPKKFTFNGTSTSNVTFATSKFNTAYTGKTVIIAAKMDASFGTNLYRCMFGSTGANRNFNFYVYNNGSGYQLHFSTPGVGLLSDVLPIATGQWYVFAVTQDASTVKFYLNGNLVGTTTGTTLSQYQSNTNENIGVSDNFWLGDIGTTMIYKRGLTAAEIMQNYLAIKATYY
jgi:hypothetical protein